MTDVQKNWAGNFIYNAVRLHYPETVEQVQEIVSHSQKLRALGTRHSFNEIADCAEDLVSLARLNRVLDVDHEKRTVTVEGGIRYGELCRALHQAGYALHNLASLPHISVAGACATATHGSGNQNGNLATAVTALEIVTANGDLLTFSHDQHAEQFQGVVVGLGGLGVITKLTLKLEPAFMISQRVYEHLGLTELADNFEEITASAYSVSLFADWQSERINQVWLKQRVVGDGSALEENDFFGATSAPTNRHPILSLSPENCTAQMGIPGPWHERLPHFRMDFMPSSGEELQSEYCVPRQHAIEALRAINRLREQMAPLLQISEIRTVAADHLWMSPCHQQPCVAFHFTWKKDWAAVKQLLPRLETELHRFQPRPHWGKLFTMPAEQIRERYERLPDFQNLLRHHDPQGKFCNAFLNKYIFGSA